MCLRVGSLSDGSRGLAAIHFAGGVTMVLGASGEAAAGMPRNATEYEGPIDFIGSIKAIADQIVRRVAALPKMVAGDEAARTVQWI